MNINITYTGGYNEKLEEKMDKFFEKEGFENVSSGYMFHNRKRDIQYEKVKGYVTAVDSKNPKKGNKFVRTKK
jgi:hypothetical protein